MVLPEVAGSGQPNRLPAPVDALYLVAQVLARSLQPVVGSGRAGPMIIIAQDGIYAKRRPQPRQNRPDSVYLVRCVVVVDVIAGADNYIGSKLVRSSDHVADKPERHEKTVVKVRQLNDAESGEGCRQVRHRYAVRIGQDYGAFDEHRIPCGKCQGTEGMFDKLTPAVLFHLYLNSFEVESVFKKLQRARFPDQGRR